MNPCRVSNPLDEIKTYCPEVIYAQGYTGELVSEQQLIEALRVAQKCKKTVLFIGLPESYESETYDRRDISMPADYKMLVERLAQVTTELVVVLANGSVVEMPWVHYASSVLETNLCGEGVGEAVAKVLFGEINPSGKLAETIIQRIEDTPSFLYTSVGKDRSDRCEYREGVFIGYRYYEKKKIMPCFVFGHGLSYTMFEYSNLTLDKNEMKDSDVLTVRLNVTNTGERKGKETIQLYVARLDSPVPCPEKELRDFCKIEIDPGQTKQVEFRLSQRAFAYFEQRLGDWYVPEGVYEILVGASSADIRLRSKVTVHPVLRWKPPVSRNTPLSDILEEEERLEIFKEKYNEIKPYLPFGLDKMDIEKDPFARGPAQ